MGQALKRGYEVLPDHNVWFAMTDGAPTDGSVWVGDGTYWAIRGGGFFILY